MKTENYLLDLAKQKKDLAENLTSFGVEVAENNLLNDLVPKVLSIPYNAISGSFTPTEDTSNVIIDGLPFDPTNFSIDGSDNYTDVSKPILNQGYIVNGTFNLNANTRLVQFLAFYNRDGDPTTINMGLVKGNAKIGVNIGCGEKSFFVKDLVMGGCTMFFKAGVTYYWTASKVENYFDITDGTLSLKAEYRGACPSDLSGQTYAVSDNGVEQVGSKNNELPEVLVLPKVVNGTTVTAFAKGMFLGNERIKAIVLPSGTTKIPIYFCHLAKNLRNVYNTNEITSISNCGFSYTKIENIAFPNLTILGAEAFRCCTYLRSINVGQVSNLSKALFAWCTRLSTIKGGKNVTELLKSALFGTRNLQNMPDISLEKVTNFAVKAFNHSRFKADWETLAKTDGITFSNYSTPYHQHINHYSQWLKYQDGSIKETISPYTLNFSQVNPEWAEQPIGEILNTEYSAGIKLPANRVYKTGCVLWSILGAYCGLKVKNGGAVEDYTFNDPRNLERALWNFATDKEALKVAIENFSSEGVINYGDAFLREKICQALGMSCEIYRGYSAENIDAFYQALLDGKYIYIDINTSSLDDPFDFHTHAVLAYGVKKNGEILVVDTGDLDAKVGVYDLDKCQILPQNMTIDSAEDISNYVMGEDGTIGTGRSITFIVLDNK